MGSQNIDNFFNVCDRDDELKAQDRCIEVKPGKLGGTPVFRGTRVPIKNFFDYLEGGDDIDTFLDDFPTVERHQVMELLEILKANLLLERTQKTKTTL